MVSRSSKMIEITNSQLINLKKKDTIVFIHGLGLNLNLWENQVDFFKKDFKILIYDLYGHGKSKYDERKPSLDIYCEQLKNLFDFYHIEKSTIVGFSLGGMIARYFCQNYPQHVSNLILLNTPHRRTTHQQKEIFKRSENILNYGLEDSANKAIDRWFTSEFIENNKKITLKIKKWILSNEKNIYNLSYKVLVNDIEKIISPKPQIISRTLIITSDKDYGNDVRMAKKINKEISNSTLKILKNLKHMALVENHKEVNKIISNFLKG